MMDDHAMIQKRELCRRIPGFNWTGMKASKWTKNGSFLSLIEMVFLKDEKGEGGKETRNWQRSCNKEQSDVSCCYE